MFEPGHIPYLCIELKFKVCLLRNRNDRKFHIYNIYHSIYPSWSIFTRRHFYHCNDNNLTSARHVNSFTQLIHCGFLCIYLKFENSITNRMHTRITYNLLYNISKIKYLLWYFIEEINFCLDPILWTMFIKI